MRKLVCSLGLMAAVGTATAGEMILVSDEELDSVYAQFGNAKEAILDKTGSLLDILRNGSTPYSVPKSEPITIMFPDQSEIGSQIIIDGSAQQNALNPINASNSAVSNVYNIFIVIDSSWENVTVNIENAVDAVNSSNIAGGAY